jgi:hypothetical protein
VEKTKINKKQFNLKSRKEHALSVTRHYSKDKLAQGSAPVEVRIALNSTLHAVIIKQVDEAKLSSSEL